MKEDKPQFHDVSGALIMTSSIKNCSIGISKMVGKLPFFK